MNKYKAKENNRIYNYCQSEVEILWLKLLLMTLDKS